VGRPLGLALSLAMLAAVVLGLCLSSYVRGFAVLLALLGVGVPALSTVIAVCVRGFRIASRLS